MLGFWVRGVGQIYREPIPRPDRRNNLYYCRIEDFSAWRLLDWFHVEGNNRGQSLYSYSRVSPSVPHPNKPSGKVQEMTKLKKTPI